MFKHVLSVNMEREEKDFLRSELCIIYAKETVMGLKFVSETRLEV